MRCYYEASELVGEDEKDDFIRADITDMTDKEKEDILSAIKDIMVGKKYELAEHTCGHDEGGTCVMRKI